MKIKFSAAATLAAMSIAALVSGCESTPDQPKSQIHGDVGMGVQSRNTSAITPERPDYITPAPPR